MRGRRHSGTQVAGTSVGRLTEEVQLLDIEQVGTVGGWVTQLWLRLSRGGCSPTRETEECSPTTRETKSEKKTKKKVLILKNTRMSTNSGLHLKNCANFHEI